VLEGKEALQKYAVGVGIGLIREDEEKEGLVTSQEVGREWCR
jgi:hypothetical protein